GRPSTWPTSRSPAASSCCSTSPSARAMQRRATPEDAGARLDAFLAAPLGSRARAQRLIEAGHVLVDGRAAPKRHRLSAGELVTVEEPEQAPMPDAPDAPYAVPYRHQPP